MTEIARPNSPSELVRGDDAADDDERGERRRFERDGETLDHVGAVTGDGGLGDRHDRTLAGAGIIFGDNDDQRRHDQPDETTHEETCAGDRKAGDGADFAEADREVGRDGEAGDRQKSGYDEPLVERAHDRIVGAELHEIGADDRGDDAGRANRERIEHRRLKHRGAAEEDRGKHHGGNDRDGVGLEQIGCHAGAIADVVAHVVGDGRGVARVVFRNASLDFADEVGADVGALGEDAAAEAREDRDERGAEAERYQRVDDFAAVGGLPHASGENVKIDRDAEQREPGDEHAGDRARLERDVEATRERQGSPLRGADVGAHRHVHADEAGCAGQDSADEEADGDWPGEQKAKDDEDDRADDGDGEILAAEIGLGPLGDRAGDLLHAGVTGIGGEQLRRCHDTVHQRQNAAENDQPNAVHRRSSPLGALGCTHRFSRGGP